MTIYVKSHRRGKSVIKSYKRALSARNKLLGTKNPSYSKYQRLQKIIRISGDFIAKKQEAGLNIFKREFLSNIGGMGNYKKRGSL